MTRRREGWGSISKVGRGAWRIRYWADTPDGYRRVSETVHGRYADAQARKAELYRERSAPRGGGVTVAEAYERWYLPRKRDELRPGTMRNVESAWRVHIAPRWGDVPLSSVSPADVQDWLREGLPPSAVKRASAIIRGIGRVSAIMGCKNSVDVSYVLAKCRGQSDDAVPIESMGAYVDAVHGSPVEAAVILGMCAGLRFGESLAVGVGDVGHACLTLRGERTECASVIVCRQLTEEGRIDEVLKTSRSRRVAVCLPPGAGPILDLVDARRADGMTWLCEDYTTHLPISRSQARSEFARRCRDAGLHVVKMQQLRPSCATLARYRYGLSTAQVADLLGHSAEIDRTVYQRPSVADVLASIHS